MDNFYEMKLMAIAQASTSRALRTWEVQCKKKARKDKSTNFPKWDERRKEFYAERMELRKYARYLHLARAYLKGLDYKDVEQSVREGNEPDPYEVYAWIQDITIEQDDIENWLTEAA